MNTDNTETRNDAEEDEAIESPNAGSDEAEKEPESPTRRDDPPEPEPLEPPPVAPPPRLMEEEPPARRGGAAAFVALLMSVAALAGTGWMWWQNQASLGQEETRVFNEIARLERGDSELDLKITELRNELDTLAAGDVSREFRELQARLQADRAQMESVEQTIREQLALSRSLQAATDSIQGRLQAAEAAVSGMSTRELDAGGELDLAEVDYLLRLANERVKLFADPVAADQALEVADMHLAALDNPMYLGVRQDIAVARRELAAVETPDFLDIANRLDKIQALIPALPFQGEQATVYDAGAVEGEGWWEKIKSAFSGLVTVRRSDGEDQAISLQDKDYIRQRVWLQLEIAHLALMRRDQAAFHHSLDRVRESIETWFEPGDEEYQAAMAGLQSLAAVRIEVDVPDITAPWSTLRLLRNAGEAPAPAPLPVEESGE